MASNDGGGNGNGGGLEMVDEVVLTYDRVHDKLNISGRFNSLDLALDMLARATRAFEAQLRTQHAVTTALAIKEAQEDQEIARRVGMGR